MRRCLNRGQLLSCFVLGNFLEHFIDDVVALLSITWFFGLLHYRFLDFLRYFLDNFVFFGG